MALLFFGITVMILAVIGVFRILNQDSLTSKLHSLKGENILLKNLLNDVEYSSLIDSSGSFEQFVSTYYENHNLGYPDRVPVKGYVTRGLNIDNNHLGIDIAAKFQDDIYSPGYGKVVFSGMSEDLGNIIIMNHPGGFITLYAHNDSNLVVSGAIVEKGQIIARVGETGNSKGPHLHFEIWKNNQILDPREIIPEYKVKDVSIR